MEKKLLTLIIALVVVTAARAQECCDVIDNKITNVITSNGICVKTSRMAGVSCVKDTDGDGVMDPDDKCPEVAGQAEYAGCLPPDTDGDGVIDANDKCPKIAGTIDGCPDSDKDGIVDASDPCPKVYGKVNGCPDTDGDGVIDKDDACRTIPGLTTLKGCPDADSDGVADKDDRCPNEAGLAANNGCPEVDEETTEIFREALTGIKFESGKDIIKVSSYSILNKVVSVMDKHPGFRLKISGHTDSQGRDDLNLDLSTRRAQSVERYLVNKGVDQDRLDPYGFGETQPVADNGTAAGRAQNRRVEFEVVYE